MILFLGILGAMFIFLTLSVIRILMIDKRSSDFWYLALITSIVGGGLIGTIVMLVISK